MIVNINGQLFVDLQKLQPELGITAENFQFCLITYRDAVKYIEIHAKRGSENELKGKLRAEYSKKISELSEDE